jgi:hypothetical protein
MLLPQYYRDINEHVVSLVLATRRILVRHKTNVQMRLFTPPPTLGKRVTPGARLSEGAASKSTSFQYYAWPVLSP